VPVTADAARAVEQARDVGLRVSFFGGDSWDTPDLFKGIHGDAAKGHYYLSQFSTSDPDPIVQEFVRGFRQRYNRSPGLLAAMGYDSISMIKEAVKRNKSGTAQGLIKSLQTLDQGSSLMGPISVDPDRNLRKGAAILFTTASGQVFKARLTQQTASAATGG
jgi:branched-chain amino acid transport system substrate-binding protein